MADTAAGLFSGLFDLGLSNGVAGLVSIPQPILNNARGHASPIGPPQRLA